MCTEFSKCNNYTRIGLQVQMSRDSCGLVRVVSVLCVLFLFTSVAKVFLKQLCSNYGHSATHESFQCENCESSMTMPNVHVYSFTAS